MRPETDYLEHWSAFHDSFERLCDWLRAVADGDDTEQSPSTIVMLGGDVHNAYINQVMLPTTSTEPSRVYQIVCSPFRNPLSSMQRRSVKMINSRPAIAVVRLLARLVRVTGSRTDWRLIRAAQLPQLARGAPSVQPRRQRNALPQR
jgi:hypothetical protein